MDGQVKRGRFEWLAGQLGGERSRVVADGHHTDDGDLCTLVAVCEVGGTWALYPLGWRKFGVRLPHAEALKVSRAILAGAT